MNIFGWLVGPLVLFYFFRRSMGGVGAAGGRSGGMGGGPGGMFGFGQSTARVVKENTGVTFK